MRLASTISLSLFVACTGAEASYAQKVGAVPLRCEIISDQSKVESIASTLRESAVKIRTLENVIDNIQLEVSNWDLHKRCSSLEDYNSISFLLSSIPDMMTGTERDIDMFITCIDVRITRLIEIISSPPTNSIGEKARAEQNALESIKTDFIVSIGSVMATDGSSRTGTRRRIERKVKALQAEFSACNY